MVSNRAAAQGARRLGHVQCGGVGHGKKRIGIGTVAPDLVNQQFVAATPDQLWVLDYGDGTHSAAGAAP